MIITSARRTDTAWETSQPNTYFLDSPHPSKKCLSLPGNFLFLSLYYSLGIGKWEISWRMASSGMLHRVALVRTVVSEELSASFIRVTRIVELGTTLAVSSNRRTHRFLPPWWRRRYVPPKRLLLQEPHGVTSKKTPFFIVTAVKTSSLTN
jgi:hypothetical protein